MREGSRDWWFELLRTLENIIPSYDRMNKVMSLGLDLRIRAHGVRRVLGLSPLLDVGSGPGTMVHVARLMGYRGEAVLLDPSEAMLKAALKGLGRGPETHAVQGVAEHLPFRDSAFRAAMSGFAIRDVYNLPRALGEIRRVLARGAPFVMVDITKPDNPLARLAAAFYWRAVVPLMALVFAGRRWRNYLDIFPTYVRMPRLSAFHALAARAGLRLEDARLFLGGASSVLVYRSIRG